MKCAQKAGKICQYNLNLKISDVNFHQSDESDQITRQIDVLFEILSGFRGCSLKIAALILGQYSVSTAEEVHTFPDLMRKLVIEVCASGDQCLQLMHSAFDFSKMPLEFQNDEVYRSFNSSLPKFCTSPNTQGKENNYTTIDSTNAF